MSPSASTWATYSAKTTTLCSVQRENEAIKEGLLKYSDALKAPKEGDVNASTWKISDEDLGDRVNNDRHKSAVKGAHGEVDHKIIGHTEELNPDTDYAHRVHLRQQLHELKLTKRGRIMDHFLRLT